MTQYGIHEADNATSQFSHFIRYISRGKHVQEDVSFTLAFLQQIIHLSGIT